MILKIKILKPKPENELTFWLKLSDDGDVHVFAGNDNGVTSKVLVFTKEGSIIAPVGVNRDLGLELKGNGELDIE